jgi:hypothetical protein
MNCANTICHKTECSECEMSLSAPIACRSPTRRVRSLIFGDRPEGLPPLVVEGRLRNMASKRRLRRKECEGKRRYVSPGEAQTAADGLRGVGGGAYIEPYQCDFCNAWHIGHRPGAMREHTEMFGEFLRKERYK